MGDIGKWEEKISNGKGNKGNLDPISKYLKILFARARGEYLSTPWI